MQSLSLNSLITPEQQCPYTKKTFQSLASEHFRTFPYLPYVIALTSSNSAVFKAFDAQHLQQHFNQHGSYIPITCEHISTIHYLFINVITDQFSLFTSCSTREPIGWQYVKACSDESLHDRLDAQKAVINWLFAKQRYTECYFWTDVYHKHVPRCLETLKIQVTLIFNKAIALDKSSSEKVALLEKVITLDPYADEAHMHLGMLYLRGSREIQPDERKAMHCFEKALLANPDNKQANMKLTELKSNSKKLSQSIALTSSQALATCKLLSLFQTLPEAYVPSLENLGDMLRIDANRRLENPLASLACLTTILKAEAENGYALARIGEIYRKGYPGLIERDLDLAVRHLEKAVKSTPDDPFVNAHLGAVYVMQKASENALTVLRKAKILSPHCIFTLTWLAKLHLRLTKNLLEAKAILEEMLDIDAHNCFALTELALLLSEGCDDFAQNLQEANSLFQRAYKCKAKKIKLLNGWAEMLRTNGDGYRKNPQAAKRLFREVLAIDSKNYLANSRTAEILRKSPSGLAAARDLFIATLQLYPQDPFCEARLGAIYLFGGPGVKKDLDLAQKLLRSSLRSGEYFALAHFGELQRRLGKDLVQAQHLLTMAYEKNHNDPDTLSFLGLLYRIGGKGVTKDRVRATALLEKAFRLAPDDDPIGERMRQPSCIGTEAVKTDYVRTKELLECSLRENNQSFYTLYALGEFLSQSPESHQSDLQRAEELLRQAIQLSPNHAETFKTLAELYRTRKDLFHKSDATLLELFLKANTLEPNDPWTLARMASCHIKMGQFEQAEAHLLAARKLTPKNALVLTSLGELLIARMLALSREHNKLTPSDKRYFCDEAEKLFNEAISYDSQYHDAHIGLGYVEIFRERLSEARRCFQHVLSHDPMHSDALDGLSKCLEQISLTS